MADEQQVVRGVSWQEVFGFSHIFKSFKMARDPGKILLALVAIVLTYGLGRLMDVVWSVNDASVVKENETWEYWRSPNRAQFLESNRTWLEETRVSGLAGAMVAANFEREKADEMVEKDFDGAAAALQDNYHEKYEAKRKDLKDKWKEKKKQIEADQTVKEEEKDKQIEAGEEKLGSDLRGQLQAYVGKRQAVDKWTGRGVFAGLLNWEMQCLREALGAIRRGRFVTGLSGLYKERGDLQLDQYKDQVPNVPGVAAPGPPEGLGLLGWLILMGWGVWWLFSVHWFYAIVFLLLSLAIWSVAGGAICRMAALHATREEKIGVRAGLRFSLSKFVGFFSAPLLPLAVILFLGFWMWLAGLVGSIPHAGEWLYVPGFLLSVIAGAVSAFLIVGLVGGGPLMWPTIAVEGSEQFDAVSRSYNYLYSRFFRCGLYGLVASVYGLICYLLFRLFAFVTVRTVHVWASLGMSHFAEREEYAVGASKLDVLWPQPTFEHFQGPMQWEAMRTGSERWAAWVLAVFVWLVAATVLAFLATFFFSAATNIYLLLRRKVDATDLDDVYVEEEPEEEGEEPPPALEGEPGEEFAPSDEVPGPEAGEPPPPGADEGTEKPPGP